MGTWEERPVPGIALGTPMYENMQQSCSRTPKSRGLEKSIERHICSLSCTPEAPDCEVKSHCWEAALPALHGHCQPRQCQAITFRLEIAPARALSWEAEHWRGQTAVSYQRQLKKDISHTGFFFPSLFFWLRFFFFQGLNQLNSPLYNFPFDVFRLIKVSFLSLLSPGEEGERTQKFISEAGSAAAAAAAAVAVGQAKPPPASTPCPNPLAKHIPLPPRSMSSPGITLARRFTSVSAGRTRGVTCHERNTGEMQSSCKPCGEFWV